MTALSPDLCVIGAGSGGLAVAAGAAQMGASVVLVERGRMGGDCLNYGCVPSKSLLAASRLATAWRRSAELGIQPRPAADRFRRRRRQRRAGDRRIAPNDSAERFERLGVRVIRAEARFVDRRTIRAGDDTIRPRRFVIATGSAPVVPPIPGLDRVPYFTNETVFANRTAPAHLIVIGGGPVGIELAQAHRGLGAAVTVIDAGPLLPHDDPELAALLAAAPGGRRHRAETLRRGRRNRACRVGHRRHAGDRRTHHRVASAGRRREAARSGRARSHRRRDRGQRQRGSPSIGGCARQTAAPSPLATRPAVRNSPMSRSTTPGS